MLHRFWKSALCSLVREQPITDSFPIVLYPPQDVVARESLESRIIGGIFGMETGLQRGQRLLCEAQNGWVPT